MTFGDVLRADRCSSVAAAFTLSGTALKPRFTAAARNSSRFLPPLFTRSTAASFFIHALTPSAGAPGSGGSEYCVPLHDDCTTCHGYVADSSVWIRIAPAAPCRAASSYLYVQRP